MKIVRLMLILSLLMVAHAAAAQSAMCESGMDYAAQAQSAIDGGDYDTAIQDYTCALEADPFNYDLHLARLSSGVMGGNYMMAFGDLFLLNNNAPEVVLAKLSEESEGKVRAFLAIFAVMPDYELALSDAEAMLSSEPDSAYAFVIQAAAHEGMEDFEAAAEAFNQAIERDSENAQIYGLMAAAQFSIFNIEGVSANANRAIELDDSLAQVYRLRGFTFMVMGDPPAAIEDANHAIELDPTYFAYYILRGNAMRATGNPEAALEDFNRIIELNPHTSFGFALRAEILMNMGDFAAAASDMATTIELDTLENVEGEMLQAGTPTTVTMTFGRVIHLTLEAQAGQILSLSATSAEAGEVDPLILLVAPDGTPLIFNDDVIPFGDSLDSAIADFEVPSDGMYTLIVTHALGGSEGDVEVLVEIS